MIQNVVPFQFQAVIVHRLTNDDNNSRQLLLLLLFYIDKRPLKTCEILSYLRLADTLNSDPATMDSKPCRH